MTGSKRKRVAIFRVPIGDDTQFDKRWRHKLVSAMTQDREVDAALTLSVTGYLRESNNRGGRGGGGGGGGGD